MPDNPLKMEPEQVFYPESAEPTKPEPTDDPVTVEDQDPPQGSDQPGNPEEEPSEDLKNDGEPAEEPEGDDDDENIQVLEIDGEEYDLNEVKAWREGNLRQSDYTRKTQALADERKQFEAERDAERAQLADAHKKFTENADMLEVLVQEDSEVDWERLKEDDLEEYIEKKELAEKRQKALEKIKADRKTPVTDPAAIQAEQRKLIQFDPAWLEEKDGKQIVTKQFTADMKLVDDYAVKAGFTAEEFETMAKSHYMITMLKAARYDQLQEKSREMKNKREKVPVVTKPRKQAKNSKQEKDPVSVFYPNG